MSKLYEEITACRICRSSALADVMSFGEQYLASSFVKSQEHTPLSRVKVPLSVVLCEACGTVQLREDVDRDALFRDYFYRSATNPMMRDALADVVREIRSTVALSPGDVVLDIGCNDATMLMMYPQELVRVGVDPASNISWAHVQGKAKIINDFFGREATLRETDGRRCRVITTIAMLYNMADLDGIVGDIASLLTDDGVWCIQLSYLPALLESMSFYDVCHEHLYYFSLATLSALVERHGLRLFHASRNEVNGGSIRVFAAKADFAPSPTAEYARLLDAEQRLGLGNPQTYHRFFSRVLELKQQVRAYLEARRAEGSTVVGLGASTKGNVLLQFFEIDKHLLPAISERNPEKVGLRTLGTDIEIVSEEQARAMKPSDMLVLIWFFKKELIARERSYLEAGGRLLFPMPTAHVVGVDGERGLA
ncbi:MAG: methyltransferase domain-containing protein [Polyangiaceae bacterium]|nr:methyltransferase domain-containing protein [Polyangiaceae bacterium]